MKQSNDASSNESFQILISPELTTLIIVDHQTAFGQCFDIKAVKSAENGLAELLGAAEKFNIPAITSLVKTNLIGPELSTRLEKMIARPARFIRSGINPWNDPAFAGAVREANRPNLLIAGLSAETSLSFTALSALERGFDVFVIKDACLGYSERSFDTTFERLIQAGVVPVSWRQVILEWSQDNIDAGLLRRILRPKKRSRNIEDTN